jgi:diguanylate cyclase (GGDEF)-like protein
MASTRRRSTDLGETEEWPTRVLPTPATGVRRPVLPPEDEWQLRPRRAWRISLWRFWQSMDERLLLENLTLQRREALEDRLHESEASKIAAFGWLAFPVFLAILQVDFRRVVDGTILSSWVWPTLAVAHLLIGASGVGAILVARRRATQAHIPKPMLQHVTLGMLVVGALVTGILGIRFRSSGFEFMLAMVVVNLVFYLPRHIRWPLVIGACIAAIVAVPLTQLRSDFATVVLLNEVIVGGFLMVAVGNMLTRERIAAQILKLQLEEVAHVDALTGVYSRRHIQAALDMALQDRGHDGPPLSVILFDIDHFKSVNDTFGHNVGDDLLRGISRVAQQRLRFADVVGRWGGEEFIVICPDTSLEEAQRVAEYLRERIAQRAFPVVGHRTASFGVATASSRDSGTMLVGRADAALYEAKRSGRNQVRAAA